MRSLTLGVLMCSALTLGCQSSSSSDGSGGGQAGASGGGTSGGAGNGVGGVGSGGHAGMGGIQGGAGHAGTNGSGGAGGNGGSQSTAGMGGTPEGGTSGGAGTAGGGIGGSTGGAGTSGAAGSPPVDSHLITYDDFNIAPSANNPDGLATGAGWRTTDLASIGPGWRFHDELSSWSVQADAPLTYKNLRTAGNYLHHANDGAGRCIDVAAYGALALDDGGDPTYLAADGSTLWLSVLIRINDDTNQHVFVTATGAFIPWNTKDAIWAAGVAPDKVGNRNWSLFVREVIDGTPSNEEEPDIPRDATSTPSATNKTMTPKATALLVLRFDFKPGAADTISLYVNPETLGGDAPAVPDAVATTKQDLSFRCFQAGIYLGTPIPTTDTVSFDLDEIRIGTTFAAVTPVN